VYWRLQQPSSRCLQGSSAAPEGGISEAGHDCRLAEVEGQLAQDQAPHKCLFMHRCIAVSLRFHPSQDFLPRPVRPCPWVVDCASCLAANCTSSTLRLVSESCRTRYKRLTAADPLSSPPQISGFVNCPAVNSTGMDFYEQFYMLLPNGTTGLTMMINAGDPFILRSKATKKYCRAVAGERRARQAATACACVAPGLCDASAPRRPCSAAACVCLVLLGALPPALCTLGPITYLRWLPSNSTQAIMLPPVCDCCF
jgi:hypothetical protein